MATRIKADPKALQARVKALLGGKVGFKSDADRNRKAEAAQRAVAKNILGTDVIADKNIDAAKLLMTTLGGQLRPITIDDLRAFSEAANRLGRKYKGGITAQGVIDHSTPVDRERANDQIRTALVVRAQSGALHFLTNAGPDSDVTRHHVHVDFPAFKAYAASPQDAKKLARVMLDGPLRFDCDCKHHRFVFRYISSRGGFASLRIESGFPKIKNPRLVGVGCKHVLRVMAAVKKDPAVRDKAAAMIRAAQSSDTKAQVTTAAEAKAAVEAQLRKARGLREVAETTKDRIARLAANATTEAKRRAVAQAQKRAQEKLAAQVKATKKQMQDALAKLTAAPMTKAMRDKLVADLMKIQTVE
jgi:hypothetical protein